MRGHKTSLEHRHRSRIAYSLSRRTLALQLRIKGPISCRSIALALQQHHPHDGTALALPRRGAASLLPLVCEATSKASEALTTLQNRTVTPSGHMRIIMRSSSKKGLATRRLRSETCDRLNTICPGVNYYSELTSPLFCFCNYP